MAKGEVAFIADERSGHPNKPMHTATAVSTRLFKNDLNSDIITKYICLEIKTAPRQKREGG